MINWSTPSPRVQIHLKMVPWWNKGLGSWPMVCLDLVGVSLNVCGYLYIRVQGIAYVMNPSWADWLTHCPFVRWVFQQSSKCHPVEVLSGSKLMSLKLIRTTWIIHDDSKSTSTKQIDRAGVTIIFAGAGDNMIILQVHLKACFSIQDVFEVSKWEVFSSISAVSIP